MNSKETEQMKDEIAMRLAKQILKQERSGESESSVVLIVGTVLGLAAAVGLTILEGYILSIMWGWMAVPLGLPAISTAHAIGLTALLTAAMPSKSWPRKEEEGRAAYAAKSLARNLTALLANLLIAWIALGYM